MELCEICGFAATSIKVRRTENNYELIDVNRDDTRNSFQANAGQEGCNNCNPEISTLLSASRDCTPCISGSYFGDTNPTVGGRCNRCAAGKYTDAVTGTTAIENCRYCCAGQQPVYTSSLSADTKRRYEDTEWGHTYGSEIAFQKDSTTWYRLAQSCEPCPDGFFTHSESGDATCSGTVDENNFALTLKIDAVNREAGMCWSCDSFLRSKIDSFEASLRTITQLLDEDPVFYHGELSNQFNLRVSTSVTQVCTGCRWHFDVSKYKEFLNGQFAPITGVTVDYTAQFESKCEQCPVNEQRVWQTNADDEVTSVCEACIGGRIRRLYTFDSTTDEVLPGGDDRCRCALHADEEDDDPNTCRRYHDDGSACVEIDLCPCPPGYTQKTIDDLGGCEVCPYDASVPQTSYCSDLTSTASIESAMTASAGAPLCGFAGDGLPIQRTCSLCPDGYQAVVDSSASGTDNPIKCEECPVGNKGIGGRCLACTDAPGAYQDEPGKSTCKICPAGKYARLGETCRACPPGKYHTGDASGSQINAETGCVSCTLFSGSGTAPAYRVTVFSPLSTDDMNNQRYTPQGRSQGDGAIACSDCPSYQPQLYQVTGGRWNYGAGDEDIVFNYYACKMCIAGKKKVQKDISGLVANSGGSRIYWCDPCDAGKYQGSASHSLSTCSFPSFGYYVPPGVLTSQTQCPYGQIGPTNTDPRTACILCERGKYSNAQTDSSRRTCAACEFSDSVQPPPNPNPTPPRPTFQNEAGQTTCIVCPPDTSALTQDGLNVGSDASSCSTQNCREEAIENSCVLCEGEPGRPGFAINPATGGCEACVEGTILVGEQCQPCPPGWTTVGDGQIDCIKCVACQPGYYMPSGAVCSDINACLSCEPCGVGEIRIGCMNEAGSQGMTGECRAEELLQRTAVCPRADTIYNNFEAVQETEQALEINTWQSNYGLGGFTFREVFGLSPADVDFQCRRVCDGSTKFQTGSVVTYGTADTGTCGGPYACNIQSCTMLSETTQLGESYRVPRACPVEDPVYVDDQPLYVYREARLQECQTCAECGLNPSGAKDWGRGCAKECSFLVCGAGEIFDWTRDREPLADACTTCEKLDNVKLCREEDVATIQLEMSDVSGRMPRLYFDGCVPRQSQKSINDYFQPTYGRCQRCEDNYDCASGFFYASCSSFTEKTCLPCLRHAGVVMQSSVAIPPLATIEYPLNDAMFAWLHSNAARNPLPCQLVACTGERTGIAVDGEVCQEVCERITCSSSQFLIPCLLPHPTRCWERFPGLKTGLEYVGQIPAHVNLLEVAYADKPALFASFENVLLDPDSGREQCVWNAEIGDVTSDPGGVSMMFDQTTTSCREWSSRNPALTYPLIPLQNTVVVEAPDTAPRRVLINTAASAVRYDAYAHPEYGPIPAPGLGNVSGAFALAVDLTRTDNATLMVFLPSDRDFTALSAANIPAIRVSIMTRKLAGDSIIRTHFRLQRPQVGGSGITDDVFALPMDVRRLALPSQVSASASSAECQGSDPSQNLLFKDFVCTDPTNNCIISTVPVSNLQFADVDWLRVLKAAALRAHTREIGDEEYFREIHSFPEIATHQVAVGRDGTLYVASEMSVTALVTQGSTVSTYTRVFENHDMHIAALCEVAKAVLLVSVQGLSYQKHYLVNVAATSTVDTSWAVETLDPGHVLQYQPSGDHTLVLSRKADSHIELKKCQFSSPDLFDFSKAIIIPEFDGVAVPPQKWVFAASPTSAVLFIPLQRGVGALSRYTVTTEGLELTESTEIASPAVFQSRDQGPISRALLDDGSVVFSVDGVVYTLLTSNVIQTESARHLLIESVFVNSERGFMTIDLPSVRSNTATPPNLRLQMCDAGFERRSQLSGGLLSEFFQSHSRCAYACREHSQCYGYQMAGSSCRLIQNSGPVTFAGTICLRSSDTPLVVVRSLTASDGRVPVLSTLSVRVILPDSVKRFANGAVQTGMAIITGSATCGLRASARVSIEGEDTYFPFFDQFSEDSGMGISLYRFSVPESRADGLILMPSTGFLHTYALLPVSGSLTSKAEVDFLAPYFELVLGVPPGEAGHVEVWFTGSSVEYLFIPATRSPVYIWAVQCSFTGARCCKYEPSSHRCAAIRGDPRQSTTYIVYRDDQSQTVKHEFHDTDSVQAKFSDFVAVRSARVVADEVHLDPPPLDSIFRRAARFASGIVKSDWNILSTRLRTDVLAQYKMLQLRMEKDGDMYARDVIAIDALSLTPVLSLESVNSFPDVCPAGMGAQHEVIENGHVTLVLDDEGRCVSCRQGTFTSVRGAAACTLCPAGTYQDAMGSTGCLSCPENTASTHPGTITVDDCMTCDFGFFSATGSGVCTGCNAGSYYMLTADQDRCHECEAGKFSNDNATICIDCGVGLFASGNGRSACEACPAGTHQPLTAQTSSEACLVCERGSYQPLVGKTSCVECPAGTFQPLLGQIVSESCLSCPQGTFSNPNTASAVGCFCGDGAYGIDGLCTPCPEYATSRDYANVRSDCFCREGTVMTPFNASFPHWYCHECPAGSFAPANASQCETCLSGSYAPTKASSSCLDCPVMTSSKRGALECVSSTCKGCPVGTYLDFMGAVSADNCSVCLPGAYSMGFAGACTLCPVGTSSSAYGAESVQSCTQCAAGKFSERGSTVCSQCPDGTVSDTIGAASVEVCKQCPAGETNNADHSACTNCPVGTTSLANGVCVSCDGVCSCGIGKELQSYPLPAVCMDCQPGTFSDADDRALCSICPPGHISATAEVQCTPCTVGTYTVDHVTCLACPPGTTSTAAQARCTECPAGTYSVDAQCHDCPDGLSSQPASQNIAACSYSPGQRRLQALVYIPDSTGMTALGLDSERLAESTVLISPLRGDDADNWERLHVTAAFHSDSFIFDTCSYRLFIARALDGGAVELVGRLAELGCTITMAGATGVCHMELPTALIQHNTNRFVAVEAIVKGGENPDCEWPDDFTVSLEPLTSLYECPHLEFWSETLGRCESCADGIDTNDALCGPGQYIPGCDALAGDQPVCQDCPSPYPDSSKYNWLSDGVCEFECADGLWDDNGVCTECTTSLQDTCSGEASGLEPGFQWAPCSADTNERCEPCPLLAAGAYANNEAFIYDAEECKSACRIGFWRSIETEPCVSCLTLAEVMAALDTMRGVGQFYSLHDCTSTVDASWLVCNSVSHATLTGDSVAFDQPCQFECNTGFYHNDDACEVCPDVGLPDGSYTYTDSVCTLQCNTASDYYHPIPPAPNVCIQCGPCEIGKYPRRANGGCECLDCSPIQTAALWFFSSSGTVDLEHSCGQSCPENHYQDFGVCRPHSTPVCVEGQYLIPGSQLLDARCQTCHTCTGLRLVTACSEYSDTVCESCPEAEAGRINIGSACASICQTGYVNNTDSGLCEACSHVCVPGTYVPTDRHNCTHCEPCEGKPDGAHFYAIGCQWACPPGTHAVNNSCEAISDISMGGRRAGDIAAVRL